MADCRVEVCTSKKVLDRATIKAAFGDQCDGAIGQLTEAWDADVFGALGAAGAAPYCNYAVGYDNVDVEAATRLSCPWATRRACSPRRRPSWPWL